MSGESLSAGRGHGSQGFGVPRVGGSKETRARSRGNKEAFAAKSDFVLTLNVS